MGISKKKRQFLKKNYPKRSIKELSAETGIQQGEIERILGVSDKNKDRDRENYIKRIIEWGIPLVVFCSPFVMVTTIRDASNLPQNAFVQVSVIFLALLWSLKHARQEKAVFRYSHLLLPMLLFLGWSGLSLLFAINPFEGIPVFLQILALVLFFALFINVYRGKRNLERFAWAMVLAGTGIAVIGVLQYLFEFSMIPQARPPAATFSNRNMASQFMVLVFPLGFYLFLTAEKRSSEWLIAVFTLLMMVYTVYIKSLAGWISMAAEVLLLAALTLWISFIKKQNTGFRKKWVPLSAMTLLFFVMINLDSGGLTSRFGDVRKEVANVSAFVTSQGPDAKTGPAEKRSSVNTVEWRWSIWMNSLAMIQDHFLKGVGLGNFKVVYPLYSHAMIKDQKFSIASQPHHTHNDYIQAGVELGVTGLVFVVWAVIGIGTIILKILKISSYRKELMLTGAISASLIGILLNAGFSFPFQRAIPPFYTILLSGMVVCIWFGTTGNVKAISLSRQVWMPLSVVLAGGVIGYGTYHYSMVAFDFHYGKTILNYNRGRWSQSLAYADMATKHLAWKKEILFYKGYAADKLGRIEESQLYYEMLLRYFPNYPNGLLNLALIYQNSGNHAKAARLFKRLIRIMPDHAGYYSDTAHNLMSMGMVDEAYRYLKQAVTLNENSEIIQFNWGMACLRKMKYDEARSAFRKAMQLKPDWEKPGQFLHFIEKQEKKGQGQ